MPTAGPGSWAGSTRVTNFQVAAPTRIHPERGLQLNKPIGLRIFNTSVWNGQDDQAVDEFISISRCDEKPSMQQLERDRRCCSKTCVHQNRSAKIFKIGSKTPTSRGNGARQSACSKDDASALSDVSKEQHSIDIMYVPSSRTASGSLMYVIATLIYLLYSMVRTSGEYLRYSCATISSCVCMSVSCASCCFTCM